MAELWQHTGPWMLWLVKSSLQAAGLVVLVLAVHWLLRRRLTARWRYALWLLVLVRLVLPAGPRTDWSAGNLLESLWAPPPDVAAGPPPPASLGARAPAVLPDSGPVARVPVGADAASRWEAAPKTEPGEPRPTPSPPPRPHTTPAAASAGPPGKPLLAVLFLAWAAGAAGLLGRLAIANVRFHRRLRRAARPAGPVLGELVRRCADEMRLRRRVAVLLTNAVRSPALFGPFRPTLLLPDGIGEQLDGEELRHVLLHELAHLRRLDVPLDWAATVLTALHWFNPMLWLARARMRADRELACDEAVLCRSNAPAARRYGQTMLKLIDRPGRGEAVAGVVGVLEKAHSMTRRIQMIASFTPNRRNTSILGIALLAALGAVALTDARAQRGKAAEPTGTATSAKPAATAPPAKPAEKPLDPNATLRKAMSRNIQRLSFEDVSLQDVIQFLREYSGANVFFHCRALEAAGIKPSTKVTVNARNITVQRALDMILRDVSGRNIGTSWEIASAPDGGVLVISSKRNLRELERGACGEVRPWDGKTTQADAALRRKLTTKIERLSFEDVRLDDVLQFLRESSGVNVHPSGPSLERIGAEPDTKICLDLKGVSVGQAIKLALLAAAPYASPNHAAAYAVEDGVVTIAAQEELSRRRDSAFGAEWYSAVTALPADHTRTLAFVQAGRIARVAVQAGDLVQAGQELVRLNDDTERMQLEELKADAANDIRLRAAEVQLEQAEADLARATAQFKRGILTAEEQQKAQLAVRVAKLAVELARTELVQARHRLAQAEVRYQQMRLLSPIAGRVERVFLGVGEAAAGLAPVVRVVKAGNDPLEAAVQVPVAAALRLKTGRTALVQIEGADTLLRGKIARIASAVDTAANRLTVHVVVANPTHRPAGERIKVSFPQPG